MVITYIRYIIYIIYKYIRLLSFTLYYFILLYIYLFTIIKAFSIEIISNTQVNISAGNNNSNSGGGKYSYKEEDISSATNNIRELKISNQAIDKFLDDNADADKKPTKKELKCTKCKNSVFYEQDELRKHFKSNWHNFNVKQSAKEGGISLSAEEFDECVLMNPSLLK